MKQVYWEGRGPPIRHSESFTLLDDAWDPSPDHIILELAPREILEPCFQ